MTRDQESDTAPSPFIRKGGKKAITLMLIHKGKEVKRRKQPILNRSPDIKTSMTRRKRPVPTGIDYKDTA